MPKLLRHYDWANWLRGLGIAVITGGSQAVTGGIGVSLLDPKDFGLQGAQFYKMVAMLFSMNATVNFFLYLNKHPLPEVVSSEDETKEGE